MSVSRIANKKRNYTEISNAVLNDDRLSYEALGVLVRLLSKPSTWKVQIAYLIQKGRTGKTRIYRILEELRLVGYVVKDVGKNADGQITYTDYTVYEEPRVVDPGLVDKLTQQQEKRRQKKRADNCKRTSKPRVAEPEMVQPDFAEPTHINERADNNERDKKEETPALAGARGPRLPISGRIVAAEALPSSSPVPGQVAADAAPEEDDGDAYDEPGVPQDGVLSKLDPRFPRQDSHPDWCTWVSRYDADHAAKLDALFPKDRPLAKNNEAARKYYQRRYTGLLTPRTIRLLTQFYAECRPESCMVSTSLDHLLRKDVLPHVLAACRADARQAIEEIQTEGETNDGPQHVLQHFMQAGALIDDETDMVAMLAFSKRDMLLGRLYAAYSRSNPTGTQAAGAWQQEIIDEISRWPSWTTVLSHYNTQLPQILGLTLDEVRGHQRRYNEWRDSKIAELQKYLS